MRLKELLNFNPIIVQCHDNPDADAIASGYAVYKYFLDAGKDVCFVYAGVNELQKANLKLMIDYLGIGDTLKYVKNVDDFLYTYKDVYTESPVFPGLVVTVDCQYGAGNVTKIPSVDMAIIDHHQIEITDVKLSEIMPGLGSCSTLVWNMLKQEGIEVEDTKLGTALYYGLYTDTNSFSEIANPMDMDLRDSIPFEKTTIHTLKNSNFSLAELDIAGVAMIRHIYNPIHKYAIIKAEQCDPNILGLISDFLLQVATVPIVVRLFSDMSSTIACSATFSEEKTTSMPSVTPILWSLLRTIAARGQVWLLEMSVMWMAVGSTLPALPIELTTGSPNDTQW